MKDIAAQPVKGFLYPAQRQRQVHADMALSVEWSAILPADADVPAFLYKLLDGSVVCLAPLGAV